jgi:multidrug efflux pump subunit AcrB
VAQTLRQANETMTTEYNEKVQTMEQELALLRQKEDAIPQIEALQAQLDTVREEHAAGMRKKDADLRAVLAEAEELKEQAAALRDQYQEELEKVRGEAKCSAEQAQLATEYSETMSSNMQVVLQAQEQMHTWQQQFQQKVAAALSSNKKLTTDDWKLMLEPRNYEPALKRLREE